MEENPVNERQPEKCLSAALLSNVLHMSLLNQILKRCTLNAENFSTSTLAAKF
jgi:hypothetical protein